VLPRKALIEDLNSFQRNRVSLSLASPLSSHFTVKVIFFQGLKRLPAEIQSALQRERHSEISRQNFKSSTFITVYPQNKIKEANFLAPKSQKYR